MMYLFTPTRNSIYKKKILYLNNYSLKYANQRSLNLYLRYLDIFIITREQFNSLKNANNKEKYFTSVCLVAY